MTMCAVPRFLPLVLLSSSVVGAAPDPGHGAEEEPPPEVVVVPPSEELEPLHAELFERAYDGNLGCLSVLVARDGEVLWEQGLGWADRERERPASVDTVYPIASVSKGFVGLAAALLAEEGKLDLDAPVADVLESFAVATGGWVRDPLRVRDLIHMKAGMPHGSFSWLREPPTSASVASLDVVRLFAVVDEEPGRTFRYGNYAAGVLEAAVHDVAGEPLESYLARRVFGPLGMGATRAQPDPADPNLVRVHSGGHVFDVAPFSAPTGGLGYLSSVRDLGKLAELELHPDRADALGLPPAVLLAARRGDRDGSEGGEYCMGWGSFGVGPTFDLTNGQVFDATSCVVLCPEREAYAVCLTDTLLDGRPGGGRLADAVALRALDLVVGGCTEAYREAERRFETERASAESAGPILPAGASRWSGSLVLAGVHRAARLVVAPTHGATLLIGGESGGLTGTCARLAEESGRLVGEFACEGVLAVLGEESALSGLSIGLARVGPERLGGSVLVQVSAAGRRTVGSGAGLLDLAREPEAPGSR